MSEDRVDAFVEEDVPPDVQKTRDHLRNCIAFALGKGATDFVLVAVNRKTGWSKLDEGCSPSLVPVLNGLLFQMQHKLLEKAGSRETEWDGSPKQQPAAPVTDAEVSPKKKRRMFDI